MSMKAKSKEKVTLETEIVLLHSWSNDEDYYDDEIPYGASRSSVRPLTIGKFKEEYSEDAAEWENLDNEHPETLLEFIHLTAENHSYSMRGNFWVMLKSEWEAQQAQKELDSMNRLAASFAKEWNVTAGTMEFVERMYKEMDKLDYDYERYNDYECRAERWMDSRYSGQSYEGYCSDEDYGHSQFGKRADNLEKIRKWLCLNCPMTMAAFSEKMIAKQANGNEEDEE